jgi:hypothetical protein
MGDQHPESVDNLLHGVQVYTLDDPEYLSSSRTGRKLREIIVGIRYHSVVRVNLAYSKSQTIQIALMLTSNGLHSGPRVSSPLSTSPSIQIHGINRTAARLS